MYTALAGTSTAVVRRGLLLADGPETIEILRAHGSPIHFSPCVHDTLRESTADLRARSTGLGLAGPCASYTL